MNEERWGEEIEGTAMQRRKDRLSEEREHYDRWRGLLLSEARARAGLQPFVPSTAGVTERRLLAPLHASPLRPR